jgi:dipeptidyl aminopeptidase/acylaminoacyl peptidase
MRHVLGLFLGLVAAPALAQAPYAPAALTADDYARAESFLGQNVVPLLYRLGVAPTWLSDDRFWYRNVIPEGAEFVLVDPARRTREPMFDHARLAAALSAAADTTYEAFHLPFRTFDLSADGRSITFPVDSERFTCDLGEYRCEAAPADSVPPHSVVSPDGRRAAFVRDHNLWVRDLRTGDETQLTTDGIEHFGYATNNAGWIKSDDPVLLWSPDSRKIATFQHDARGVGEMYLVSTNVGHPRLEAWRYPLPGDSLIFRIERVIIDLDAPGGPRLIRLRMPPDQHRSTVCDHVVCGDDQWVDVAWTPDGSRLAFVSSSRDHKHAVLRVADAETGEVRDVLEETLETFYESGFHDANNWRFLAETDEIVWYSQRDDWGHLYLYDLRTGEFMGRLTEGAWNVLRILRIDPESRTIWFLGNGREPGDPYFQYLYRIGLDGMGLTLLTPDSANHQVSLSPSGRYFVDTSSTPVEPPVSVLRDAAGEKVLDLEVADITRLAAIGWQPPIPFSVKARDGQTDLYGLMYRPTRLDPSKKYPIINQIYPGPQSGSVGARSFGSGGSNQALAELGFVVVAIDAMGTPLRSKSFHEAYYGNMGDNGLPDHIAGMRQLAERYPWIDLDRVGITGHSGGGYAAADAILRYPDFFDVAVATSGNNDNRNYEDDWGEKWQGLLETRPDGTTNYDNQANQLLAENLRGKLLLTHGAMDDNVPLYGTLLLVEALIAANKDFDFILFPSGRHSYGAGTLYMTRRRWDYFVRHLLGAEPPAGYRLGEPAPPIL